MRKGPRFKRLAILLLLPGIVGLATFVAGRHNPQVPAHREDVILPPIVISASTERPDVYLVLERTPTSIVAPTQPHSASL